MNGTKKSYNLHALLTPNLRNRNSANNTEPDNEWDDTTTITDNRSGVTSRVTSEGGQPDCGLEDERITSEGGHGQNTEEQNETARRRNNTARRKLAWVMARAILVHSPVNPFKYSFSLPAPSNTLCYFAVISPPSKTLTKKLTFRHSQPHLPHLWAYLPPPSKTLTKISTF